MSAKHTFLFQSLESTKLLTTRKIHIKRLHDVLQLCLLRHDHARALRAWSILVRCKELDEAILWSTSLAVLAGDDRDNTRRTQFLREAMLKFPDERMQILKELVLSLALSGRSRQAMDELELYLPSFPYQNNPVLHTYAGLIMLHMAQETNGEEKHDPNMLRTAKTYFERAKMIDLANVVAQGFLERISTLSQEEPVDESDNDIADEDERNKRNKRARA